MQSVNLPSKLTKIEEKVITALQAIDDPPTRLSMAKWLLESGHIETSSEKLFKLIANE